MPEFILKGIIIGLSISVPLGPIGMLTIQRTLQKGRKFGFFTGLGATTSDLVYIVLTLFFLNFIEQFIEDQKLIIQIGGSIIIALFGLYIFKSNPAVHPKIKAPANENLFKDYITSFLLTFSNPLIIFVMIALFARFGFGATEVKWYELLTGITSILAGAVLWWSVLTYFASKFRKYMNMWGLKLINVVTGSIIMLIGCAGFILSLIQYL
jgi:threonine/homoserine/homoserine lactone efflux protein